MISSVALARVDVGISIGVPGVVYPAPVYVAPAPVYVAPPPPVYYRPAPVYVAPPVVYPGPVYYGGGRYYDRREWRGPGTATVITAATAMDTVTAVTDCALRQKQRPL